MATNNRSRVETKVTVPRLSNPSLTMTGDIPLYRAAK